MPHFFFHIYDNGNLIPDEEGTDCADLEGAKHEAKASVRDLACQAIHRGEPPSAICVEIHDGTGAAVAALTVQEILDHPRAPSFAPSCSEPTRPQQRLH